MKNSPYSYNELLEIATGFKKQLKNHLPVIKSICPEVDQDFIYRFKALYYEVQSHPNEQLLDNQVFNLELKELADQVRTLFPILRFYLNKAFPYESKLSEAYGYCEIEKVVRDYSSLRKFMEGSVELIHEKKSELKAANCPGPTLEEIELLSKRVADTQEEYLQYVEKQESRNKIFKNKMNELFLLMETVSDATSKSLQENPELLFNWTLPIKEQIQ